MRWVRIMLPLLPLLACGRIFYDPLRDAGAGGPDAPRPPTTDSGTADDAGESADAGPPTGCRAVGVMAAAAAPVALEIVGLSGSGQFAAHADTGIGVSWARFRPDGTEVVHQSPLETGGTGAWGLAGIALGASDDQLMVAWRDSLSRVDRHLLRAGRADVATADVRLGSLVDRGVACALGSEILFVHDEQGLGDPFVLVALTADASSREVLRDPTRRHPALAARADGGAIVAMSEGLQAGRCEVAMVSALGVVGSRVPVTVDPPCARVAVGERSDGVIALAAMSGPSARVILVPLDPITLSPMGPITDVGSGDADRPLTMTTGADGAVRVTWHDGVSLVSRSFATSGATRGPDCVLDEGATPGPIGDHHSAHVRGVTGLLFHTGRSISFLGLPD